MLICAYLMNDKPEVARRQQEVEQLLMSEVEKMSEVGCLMSDSNLQPQISNLKSELACYLALSLFIVTHDPKLRKEVKAWRQSHPDCPLVIRRFLSIAKQIRC